MLSYIACPYSHPDATTMATRYIQVAKFAAEVLRHTGENVFSPITHSNLMVCFDDNGCRDIPHSKWMELDLEILQHCNKCYVLMLPGWQDSKGVAQEIAFCNDNKIQVIYCNGIDDVLMLRELIKPIDSIDQTIKVERVGAVVRNGSRLSVEEQTRLVPECIETGEQLADYAAYVNDCCCDTITVVELHKPMPMVGIDPTLLQPPKRDCALCGKPILKFATMVEDKYYHPNCSMDQETYLRKRVGKRNTSC